MFEPQIVLAASPREWAQRLHRHVADHGGGRVRATVLHPHEALAEHCDVFLADDTTSFLSRHLVSQLQQLGRRVLGVYDGDDAAGKGELLDLGVDDVIARDAPAGEFVEAIAALASGAGSDEFTRMVATLEPAAPAPPELRPTTAKIGRLIAVGAPPGGCGATEVALAVAAAAGRHGHRTVLLDGDETAPALAQRLGVRPYPNLRSAVAAVEHADGRLEDSLVPTQAGFAVLPGLSAPRDWTHVRPHEVTDVAERLLSLPADVIANLGARLEDLGAHGPGRYAVSRALLARADSLLCVGLPSPVGVARLLSWLVQARSIAPRTPVRVAFNRTPPSRFRRREVEREVRRVLNPDDLVFLPEDARVGEAAWAGGVVGDGPFTHAVQPLAATLLGLQPSARRRVGGRR
jgi:MinD-like ATPase involved in chromosome partitioning or flagellar assembly